MTSRLLWSAALACLAALGLGLQAAATAPAADSASLRVVASSAGGVVLELASPPYVLEQVVHDGRTDSALHIAGLQETALPGAPQLPLAATLLALPPGTEAVVAAVEGTQQTAQLPHLPAPAAQAVASLDPAQALPAPAAARYIPDPQVYARNAFFPAQPVQIDAPVQWRGQRVAAVRLYPVQVNPTDGALRFLPRLRVQIRFVQAAAAPAAAVAEPAGAGAPAGPLDRLVQQAVINADVAPAWRAQPASAGDASVQAGSLDPAQPWYKVAVERAGLYSLACPMLAAAGAPVAAIDLATVQLYTGDSPAAEVALRVLDANGNRRCDAGDSLEFWGEALPPGHPSAKYTGINVYWLTYGAAPGKRMAERASAAGGAPVAVANMRLRFEQNRYYRSVTPAVEDYDHWFWTLLSTASPTLGATASYTITLDHVAAGSTGQVTVTLAGLDGPHHTVFSVNNRQVGERDWSGRTLLPAGLALPSGLLHDGDNILRVQETAPGSSLLVDSFELVYPRTLYAADDSLRFEQPAAGTWRYTVQGFTNPAIQVFDVTEPANPAVITLGAAGATAAGIVTPCPCTLTFADAVAAAAGPRTYVAATDDRRLRPLSITAASRQPLMPAGGADYIAVAPATWLPALEPLLALHRTEGLRVLAVSVEDVYDRYAGGRTDPAALRAFLAEAYNTWTPPAPSYVLLVGDGSFDPRGYCAVDGACPELSTPPAVAGVPPYLRLVDPWLGETAADNQLATLDAGSPLPSLAIGRLPVNTLAETQALVAKIVAYARGANAGSWQRQALLVSDDAYNAAGTPEPAGNFWQAADGVAAALQQAAPWLAVERMYLNPCNPAQNQACALPNPPYAPYADGGALHASLTAALNEGRALVGYVGHAAIGGWDGVPFLQGGDAAALVNNGRPAVTFDLACYTGYYHFPGYPSLAEELLRNPSGGAVATWASSGMGENAGHATLGQAFAEAVAQPGRYTVGMAAVHAKQALFAAHGTAYADDLDTFHLFGDPALRLADGNASPTPTATAPASSQPTLSPGPMPTLAPGATPTPFATPVPTPLPGSATPTPIATAQPSWHLYLPHAARGGSGGAP